MSAAIDRADYILGEDWQDDNEGRLTALSDLIDYLIVQAEQADILRGQLSTVHAHAERMMRERDFFAGIANEENAEPWECIPGSVWMLPEVTT